MIGRKKSNKKLIKYVKNMTSKKETKPNKMKYILIGIAIGIVIGIAVFYMLSSMRIITPIGRTIFDAGMRQIHSEFPGGMQ